MFLGLVTGQVWSTRKHEALDGWKLLTVDVFDAANRRFTHISPVIAADSLGAGIGDYVVVALGRAARNAMAPRNVDCLEAAIVGIVDAFEATGVEDIIAQRIAAEIARLEQDKKDPRTRERMISELIDKVKSRLQEIP